MQETICAENNRINLIDGSGKVDIRMGHIKAHVAVAVAFRFVLSVLDTCSTSSCWMQPFGMVA